jgi:hypothetical protein
LNRQTQKPLSYFQGFIHLLHLNGTRGLAGKVVADAAHAIHLIDDAGRDLSQELVAEGVRGGSHEVAGGDGTEQDNVGVDALVAHHSDGPRRVKGGVGLADIVVQTGFADHRDEDVVGLAGHLDLLLGDFAQNADGETGAYDWIRWMLARSDSARLTREGVASDQLRGNVHLATELADLILEQFTQRLDQLEAVTSHQALSNAADVVVSLDSLGRTLERDTLDDVCPPG